MPGKQLVYFCKISAPSEEIVKGCEFFALKKYIKDEFSLTAIEDFGGINSQECIVIAFARMQDLHNGAIFNTLVDKGLRCISGSKGKSTPDDYFPHPIILIGLEDIMQGNIAYSSEKIIEKLTLDPRFRFWDSSIWHRYVPLNKDFKTNFVEALDEIWGYFEQGLYTTDVSREFLEFQTRMLVNSYLTPIGERGHATDVTPYKFHSETAMKEKADRELIKIKSYGGNLKWRFLLIDDFANKALQGNSDVETKTKQQIIESVLKEKVKNIEICSPKSSENLVDWALNKLKGQDGVKMYDIILLDYLLGKNTEKGLREIGSEFLEKLNCALLKKEEKSSNTDDEKLKKNKGPMGKFWIFPISVFSQAMLDEIHQKGIEHINENWYLSAGANPVNTPQLVRYNLYKLMNLQVKLAPEGLSEFMKRYFESNEVEINVEARKSYPYLIKLRSEHEILQKDIAKNSLFAKSIKEKLGKKTPKAIWEKAIWEHLTHLIYLLAYGSPIEWPEMWEEYNYVKKYFDKDNTEFMNKIREYIIKINSH